ncbi:NrdH-redoxin [Candidatus Giovannonibacteria bacterium RIFCSPHIGHO2_01_FULL_45_33]|uniref:NrdH-redoxin n=1 Tax=Candidatus Giovannonibacteria bacterium RIFCSPLOWO2_01_FULL_45_34 TaxID=1798351 RepID=A0A1F5X1F9_9BACT|nr:MAG: NrdH-redoxin [Candidatus Giovannonibacteria bacterium RIFCSPHIGHO2_01_FULL_45_33]OGF70929.1 MAG: NrdH-redoxin [Candidatus Giovannonibacteria bacterium RIFCSPHIGHO2_02_FULL_44_11]OGF81729.1 MAG: NrdH-redoxin [Candidatus Giovannonibacteria bacterium RIFCSPLOWO2_01_FULL_45_34]
MAKKVAIYSTPWCVYCKMAKKYFADNKIEYTEHDVAEDIKARDEMVKKTGQMGVPVIDIDGELTIGFDQMRLKALLGL